MGDEQQLSFRISSGLKNVIGKDLISDKYIAIFELVKNAYDAGAHKVVVSYYIDAENRPFIAIEDDGIGMNYDDIINKWLFVAYSEKKDEEKRKSYRDEMRREYAGAKGIGRFSCDCLGATLTLSTNTEIDENVHVVEIDWDRFDVNSQDDFVDIPVSYHTKTTKKKEHGTIIRIDNLRESWNREDLIKLKRSLAKLINPMEDGEEADFTIEMCAPSEQEEDNRLVKYESERTNIERDLVNGIIRNTVIDHLKNLTTSLTVAISENGKVISTIVNDRGKYVFSLKEKNREYSFLKNIKVTLYYLNQGAKVSFTRFMGGVSAKAYGSVFVYKNNFRISPYGEPGQDIFGIDSRKQQGFMRYLGTRELMGNIIISGDNEGFVETSSRAHGFVNTPSVQMLSVFFVEKVLKILERYVTQIINWGQPIDDEKVVEIDDIKKVIIHKFLGAIHEEDIIDINFGEDVIPEKKDHNSIDKQLSIISEAANDSNNSSLKDAAELLRKKTDDLVSRTKELEAENRQKELKISQVSKENEITKRQIFFLESASKQDVNNLLNGYHSIYTLTDAMGEVLEKIRTEIESKGDKNSRLVERIEEVVLSANKVKKMSDLALNGNLALKQTGQNDVFAYLNQYVVTDASYNGITYTVNCNKSEAMCRFDVTAVGIIVDNIVSNSVKARASELIIDIADEDKCVKIYFVDNGDGLDPNIDAELIFERGATLNTAKKGFGIGLPHIKELVEEMKGKVYVDSSYKGGFKLIMELRK